MKKDFEELYKTAENSGEAISRLVEIVKVLRVLCPWDKVQTHETLRKCMIEEAYEAVDAINKNDKENLREELGDVLLQVIFHSDLAEESKDFNLVDVINEECEKMIRRHPHIFSDGSAKTVDKVLEKWENIKSEEHNENKLSERLYKVPDALPALIRAEKVQSKAAKVGFDWPDKSGALLKLREEISELEDACDEAAREHIVDEFGDLLFSMVNVSRFLDINPEDALNRATAKFIKRFDCMEDISIENNLMFEKLSLEEMDQLWEAAKKRLEYPWRTD